MNGPMSSKGSNLVMGKWLLEQFVCMHFSVQNGTYINKGCSRNYPQGGGLQKFFSPKGGGIFQN